jgi:Peptidase family M28
MKTTLGRPIVVTLLALLVHAADSKLTPPMQSILDAISANSLRGHLSFIASDALEGRETPSRGLDVAAEYIAAQFRRAGLDPAAGDSYFQTAKLLVREQNPDDFLFVVTAGGKTLKISSNSTRILPEKALALDDVPLTVEKSVIHIGGVVLRMVNDPRRKEVLDAEIMQAAGDTIESPELVDLLKNSGAARATLHVGPRIERPATARNVAGILQGSDPVLRDTYVMASAHYDHLGMRIGASKPGEDVIFNGANDDGSGTVSVIEIAAAMARQNPRPKRSIVFVAFFGEELGNFGSAYYARHPLAPLAKTIADVNIEQVGRTDDSEGAEISKATVTGFDFSTMTKTLVEAGNLVGLHVHPRKRGDFFFLYSDNAALAAAGIPAHTFGVGLLFPDHHQVGDEWQKIDYENMTKVDRAAALGIWMLASEALPPEWNAANPETKAYVEAAQRLLVQVSLKPLRR